MNETASLLKRCYEAMGYISGDYTDAAATTLWLQTHGLDGLGQMHQQIEQLSAGARAELEIAENQADNETILDANATSVLVNGRKIAEFALARALQHGSARITVRDCRSPLGIVASMSAMLHREYVAFAGWQDDTANYYIAAHKADALPDIAAVTLAAATTTAETQNLTIVCSQRQRDIDAEIETLRNSGGATRIVSSGESMQREYDDQLENGLFVDPTIWNALCETADAVLVTATEQSRRGAGA